MSHKRLVFRLRTLLVLPAFAAAGFYAYGYFSPTTYFRKTRDVLVEVTVLDAQTEKPVVDARARIVPASFTVTRPGTPPRTFSYTLRDKHGRIRILENFAVEFEENRFRKDAHVQCERRWREVEAPDYAKRINPEALLALLLNYKTNLALRKSIRGSSLHPDLRPLPVSEDGRSPTRVATVLDSEERLALAAGWCQSRTFPA